jgi:hypothetical protein
VSGPPNDEPSQPFMGRLTVQSDGTKVVTTLSHKQQVVGHQQRVAELVRAAEDFNHNPTPETQQALIKAALAL